MDGVVNAAEAKVRAQRIRLVLTDNDGVLTDAGVYYSSAGEELKRFSLRDGMGVERLSSAGIATAIITRERSGPVARRAEKLRIPHLYLGIEDKRAHLPQVLSDAGCGLDEVAYVGDDVNDLGIILAIGERGLTAAPADAMPEVKQAVHYVAALPGGHGAFREFAEWILSRRGSR
jgi:3-deoxy-D-manno-octulosonate 8-phosphate phosphatase (KDO 8-P phosphatase)